jgi:hypothetical protein
MSSTEHLGTDPPVMMSVGEKTLSKNGWKPRRPTVF